MLYLWAVLTPNMPLVPNDAPQYLNAQVIRSKEPGTALWEYFIYTGKTMAGLTHYHPLKVNGRYIAEVRQATFEYFLSANCIVRDRLQSGASRHPVTSFPLQGSSHTLACPNKYMRV
jgi:hypothetical protein